MFRARISTRGKLKQMIAKMFESDHMSIKYQWGKNDALNGANAPGGRLNINMPSYQ